MIVVVAPGQGSQSPGFLAPWLELDGARERLEGYGAAAGVDLVTHGTVSDADTMLGYINPKAKKPDQVAILTREGCVFCAKAKKQLAEAGFDYVEIPLPHTIRSRAIGAIAGSGTVPQVFINGDLIGGSEALEKYLQKAA